MIQKIQKYLYPDNLTLAPLEYEWDGFKCVYIISSTDTMEEVAHWYDEAFPDAASSDEEDYRIYSFDAGDLHLAQAKNTNGLQAFVGSSVLKNIAERQHEGIIGVLRFHDYHWDVAPEGPLEGKMIL